LADNDAIKWWPERLRAAVDRRGFAACFVEQCEAIEAAATQIKNVLTGCRS
jgi:hypothetical protein